MLEPLLQSESSRKGTLQRELLCLPSAVLLTLSIKGYPPPNSRLTVRYQNENVPASMAPSPALPSFDCLGLDIRRTLNGYEAARKSSGVRDSRHRIEHVEVLRPDDLPPIPEMVLLPS
jgi:hypothetical protein